MFSRARVLAGVVSFAASGLMTVSGCGSTAGPHDAGHDASGSAGADAGGAGHDGAAGLADAGGSDGGAAGASGAGGSDGGAAGTGVGGADGGASDSGDGGGIDGDAGNLATAPDLTTGVWLICNAIDTSGRNWTGHMTFTTETPTATGASVAGTFHWLVAAIGQTGDTQFRGTYAAATRLINVDELNATGSVVDATDTMTYDPQTDRLVDGAWTCGCAPGSWKTAIRLTAANAGATCAPP